MRRHRSLVWSSGVAIALVATPALAEEAVPVTLWVNETAQKPSTLTLSPPDCWRVEGLKSPPLNCIRPHPCGTVMNITTTQIPPYSKSAYLQPEQVHEISRTGQKIRTWRTPVDSYPVQVKGDLLRVESYAGSYWIAPSGRIWKADGVVSSRGKLVVSGCGAKKLLGNSDYAQCVELVDGQSQRQRRLVFEAVCT